MSKQSFRVRLYADSWTLRASLLPLSSLCVLAAVLGGCGQAKRATVCLPHARWAMARFLAVSPRSIAGTASVANNGMPQCALNARPNGTKRVLVVANVDTAPQAYFRLERTAVEAAQNFTSPRLVAPPEHITGLGP